MLIRCWGSRGSIPVSGREYVKYGGDTTCVEIRAASGDVIIIDAGTGIRKLGLSLAKDSSLKLNFIFTHAHWDHLMGFPFFEPLYNKETEIIVYRCPFPEHYAENMINRLMTPPHFPVRYSDLKANISFMDGCPEAFKIGSVLVEPIPLSHPNNGCGYRFSENGKTFVFLTDNELSCVHNGGLRIEDYIEFSRDADLLFHDAEYTPEEYKHCIEWGHSTYTDALELGIKAGVKKLGLFHLNRERTDEDMDSIVEECRRIISEKGVKMDCFAVGYNYELKL